MSLYHDTTSRAEDKLPSTFSAPKEDHCPTEPRETRGFLIKAYSLMYGTGLVWIAVIVAWAFSLVRITAILLLSLTWTGVTAVGSRPDLPNLEIFQAVITVTIATLLTVIAVLMMQGFRKMLNSSPVYAGSGAVR